MYRFVFFSATSFTIYVTNVIYDRVRVNSELDTETFLEVLVAELEKTHEFLPQGL